MFLENISVEKVSLLTPLRQFQDIKNYFNACLEKNLYKFIPRKKPILDEEIEELWIPSINKNLSYHAIYEGRVVGSATVFSDVNSTGYELASKRKEGALGLTVDKRLKFNSQIEMILIEQLIKDSVYFYDVIPVEDSNLRNIYRSFNLLEQPMKKDSFKSLGLSGDAIKFTYVIKDF